MPRCYGWRGVHIPGCMGCAAIGHHRCTCNENRPQRTREEQLERKVAALEAKIRRLEAR